MATVTSSTIAISSFTGLKAVGATVSRSSVATVKVAASAPKLSVKASLKDAAIAAVAVSASTLMASNALAFDVLVGDNDGAYAFKPATFSVLAGEKIVFKYNSGFDNRVFFHKLAFDEFEVPAGVDAAKISMGYDEYLDVGHQTYEVTLTEKGIYGFYCEAHKGAGMVGKLTVT